MITDVQILKRSDLDSWPYGEWGEPTGAAVIFNRRYEPIVRILGDQTTPVDPNERIAFVRQSWFYRDITSPRLDRTTRARLLAMIEANPELRAEIVRR
jgi:hypothetical protein